MKILFWLNTFLPDLGGIQTFTADLMPHLQNMGHELMLVADYGNGKRPPFAMHGDVPVYCFDTIRPLFAQNPAGIMRTRIAIQKLINDFQPDLIHLHPCGPEILYYLQITKSRPISTLVTLHNNNEVRGLRPAADSGLGRLLTQADRITAVSDEILGWMLAHRPELAGKSQTILNGISPQSHPIKPLPWEPPTLLFLGRLAPQKRVDVLLQAIVRVRKSHPAVRLNIAGDGVERDDLISLTAELDLNNTVKFLGRVDHAAVPDLLNTATLFVMSSAHEGLPIAALEAAQMARPIVSTRVGGMGAVVQDGKTGLLVEHEDVAGLADAICELLNDPAKAGAFGKAGQEHVKNEFGMDQCAEKYSEIYKSLELPAGECANVQ